MSHPLQWTAPQPYWRTGQAAIARPGLVQQPQILRFATDDFIEQLLSTLAHDPASLPALTAQYETWRAPHVGLQPNPQAWLERPASRLLPVRRKLLARAQAQSGLPALPAPPSTTHPIKLYQPVHQRHYLVAASLVCQTAGLPDRTVDVARQKVSFVLRRILPTGPITPNAALPVPTHLQGWTEYAWVSDEQQGHWQEVPAGLGKPLPTEERLSTFPARFTDLQEQARRLFVGSVPVGRREVYQSARMKQGVVASGSGAGAQAAATLAQEQAVQARRVQLQSEVLSAWLAQLNQARDLQMQPVLNIYLRVAFNEEGRLTASRTDKTKVDAKALRRLRSQLQLNTWYILLDLRAWLSDHMPGYLSWLDGLASYTRGALPPQSDWVTWHTLLQTVQTPAELIEGSNLPLIEGDASADLFAVNQVAIDLPDALRRIGMSRGGRTHSQWLEGALSGDPAFATVPFSMRPSEEPTWTNTLPRDHELTRWPDFLFLLVDPWHDVPPPLSSTQAPANDPADYPVERIQKRIADLMAFVPATALDLTAPVPQPGLASFQPSDMREAWYVMRMVHERPDCAPFEGTLLSAPTEPFQLASFFDPDAPARPIRIGLPVDISPAGLRKFDRNTVFMMSDMLCGHIDRFKGITFGDLVLSVLPWPFHKDFDVKGKGPCKDNGDALGVMCSLSIPIITICALILLTIIVSLLDFIFRWLPLFIVCFPVPGFKGKKAP
ncbi:hypothetical protein [Aquabacterium parvum]|uniref:hypothetical protein n=1 Tax=Aquabacterium parvum TaxID=70584 RepID=UPI000A6D353C|nr:hypothetical protein [Aquabacterium parvum]MBU0917474.1 hypothetical protein [Gammaproteobacteria bacterium]